jgi:acetyl-CoA C-acetyltransferase
MNDVVITAALRSAVGKFSGSIAKVAAVDLGSPILRALLAHTGVQPDPISQVIMGQVLTAGVDQNPGRQALIRADQAPDSSQDRGQRTRPVGRPFNACGSERR